MKGTLITFTVPTGKDKTRSSAFAKAFYGQDTTSHKGKYKYHIHSLLDDIPHNKLIRGVIIIQNNDVKKSQSSNATFGALSCSCGGTHKG